MTGSGAFAYVAPGSVADAIAVLEQCTKENRRAQVLAGGTDLLVQLRGQDRSPRTLIDIKKIADTTRLDLGKSETFIGAALSSAVLNENPELVKRFPGLLEAADLIGSTQIQGRATMGGNLCNASPAGDSIPAMIVNGAVCIIAGKVAGKSGTRELAVENFVVGVGRSALKENEFLIGLKLPNPGPRTSDAYLRFIPRTEMDIAVAGCAVSLSFDAKGICTAARVAIGAVAPTALLVPAAAQALIGTSVDDVALEAAGAACSAAASPITDKRGTEAYRRKVVGVLCRRAAAIARQRALA